MSEPHAVATAIQVTFDCADPAAQASFWALTLRYVLEPPPPGFDSWGRRWSGSGSRPSCATPGQPPSTLPVSVRGCSSSECPRARRPRTGSTWTSGPAAPARGVASGSTPRSSVSSASAPACSTRWKMGPLQRGHARS